MRLFRRAFTLLLVAVPSLALVLAGGGYLWLRTSLPTTKGTVRLTGPESAIEIFRDAHGIPHIRAANQRDAYFALGYVHAQDRLWQMELMRRTASGRLAEMGGARLLAHDRAMRTLGLARLARHNLKNLSAPVKAALGAYARSSGEKVLFLPLEATSIVGTVSGVADLADGARAQRGGEG